MANSKILAADMWSVFHFGDPNARYRLFLETKRDAMKRFLESFITHDKVIIPTDDYMSLAVAVAVLGERGVLELIDEDALGFVRIKGALAYVGNGGGLKSYQIKQKDGGASAFCAPMNEALDWLFAGMPRIRERKLLERAVISATHEIASSVIYDEVRDEVIRDVARSSYLRSEFGFGAHELNRLPDIGPKSVVIFGGEGADRAASPIDALLRLAHANLEIRAAKETGADDLSTACPIGHVLKSKEAYVGKAYRDWTELHELTDLPDIAEVLLNDKNRIGRFLKLRRDRHATEFRRWFFEHGRSEPKIVAKEYLRILRRDDFRDLTLGRCIRFIATTYLGMKFGDTTGTVAGAVDSFVIDKFLRRPNAKIFIERLRQFTSQHH